MAYCITSKFGSDTCPQVKLTVTTKSSTATQAVLEWKLQYVAHGYAVSSSVSKSWSVSIAGSKVDSGTYSINGRTGTSTIASGTKTITKTHSAQTISFSLSFDFEITWSGTYGGTKTASGSISVAKKTSYTVSYNANGGSGVPSSQTKWHGETLTLSSTTPTRSGYTFVGWGTSTSDTSSDYSAGGSYTSNAGATLYAIWKKTITLSYNTNGGSTAPSSESATVYNATTSKTFTVTSTVPTKAGNAFLGWATSATAKTASYKAGQTISLSSNGTLYAVWQLITYTVSYNANGGTNAPASQTKTHGTDLALSSSTPTRSGYNFKGWATSSSATSPTHYPNGVYTTNANLTLYAVWERATFTVSYNANGGINAPASQTKYHGTNLTLTSAVPTRKYYTFKGWAASPTATEPTHYPNGVYTTNSDSTFYAVWEVAYIIPRITGLSVIRCDANRNPLDDGTYALVKFNWATDEPVSSVKIYWKEPSSTYYTSNVIVSASGKSGSVSEVVGGGALSEDLAYNFKIEIADNTDLNSATQTLAATLFPIDMLAGGKGVTIGGPAKEEGFVVKMLSIFEKALTCKDDFTAKTITADNTITAKGVLSAKNGLEVYHTTTPYIDFHYGNSAKDYTSRIVETVEGTLSCLGSWSIRDTLNVGGRLYGVNKVLWSGALFMSADQTVTLSAAVTAQPNGILLKWSAYASGAAQPNSYHYTFVPKQHIASTPGGGVVMTVVGAQGGSIAHKYVYINDTTIVGHANNNAADSTRATNIKVSPTSFVLREVIGV